MDNLSILINKIIEEELAFFMAVKSRDEISPCQQSPQSFVMARKMTHSVQSEAFLNSYYQDLLNAKIADRNPMTEKYARMENLIPRTNFDKHIDLILEIEADAHAQVVAQYPHIMKTRSESDFANYLSCELQTLSSQSLSIYYDNLASATRVGRNLSHERYENFMKILGLPSLAEQEEMRKK